jgi:hypothetical protein
MKKLFDIIDGPTKKELFDALRMLSQRLKPHFNVDGQVRMTLYPLITKIKGHMDNPHLWTVSLTFEARAGDPLLMNNFPKKIWRNKIKKSRLKKQFCTVTARYSTKTKTGEIYY